MTRREFVTSSAAAAFALSTTQSSGATGDPWYRRTCRWGQTNITEKDPVRYDIPWWREYWKRTEVQGVIINAGGIVAYYPSKFPLQHQADFLNGRDLYGEVCKAAHDDGLAVLARMDSNRTSEEFYRAHPDWFCRDSSGNPYRAADKFVTCVNSAYYEEYLPDVMREIIDRSHPRGSPTTVGAACGETVSATAKTARTNSARKSGARCRPTPTGTIPSIANGSIGTTPAARSYGTRTIESRRKPAVPTVYGSA